jgi:hypothetical protein
MLCYSALTAWDDTARHNTTGTNMRNSLAALVSIPIVSPANSQSPSNHQVRRFVTFSLCESVTMILVESKKICRNSRIALLCPLDEEFLRLADGV